MSLAFYIGCSYAGLVGVCVAWAVSYPLVFTGMLLTTSRASGVTAAGALTAMMAPVLAAVVMTGAVLAFRSAVPGDDQLLVRLFGSVGIGAIAYAAIIGAVAGRDIWGDITSLSAMLGRHKPDAAVA